MMLKSAIIIGNYRYRLDRKWHNGKKMAFIMLNPSKADSESDDPTLRRCIGFAKGFGYGHLIVGNLFAYRTSNPTVLMGITEHQATGEQNAFYVSGICEEADAIVLAWGNMGMLHNKGKRVLEFLRTIYGDKLYCLGMTQDENPCHPLYLKKSTQLVKL